ncbi:MAG TPA: patatin-like phospholipase family protein, partial [Thermoanaerobaculia bacterium]|nr:patatin-like phospholipase family protein [Thermoanaerobaculia bacterium]
MTMSEGHELSFAEVLEDEYGYLCGDVKHQRIDFDRRHVREIGDLARRLEIVRKQGGTSRWHLLASYLPQSPDVKVDPEEGVLIAFRKMLKDETLLHQLLENDSGIVEDINRPDVRGALLRIPAARRLLLQEEDLTDKIADDEILVSEFASRSPAVRLLLKDGFGRAFKVYPALLSIVADEMLLADALIQDGRQPGSAERRRKQLVDHFVPKEEKGFVAWLRGHGPKFLRKSAAAFRKNDVATISRKPSEVARVADQELTATQSPEEAEQYPERLARFNAVLIETVYRDYLSDGHYMRSLYGFAHEQQMAALCLSGGGIRSATFNLGVLQGLADHRVLNRFHYISTVSGGGYIGGWLSSWIRRHHEGVVGVAKDLSREPTDPLAPEVKPIHHLREYSSYLAPRSSAFSVDSWTIVAIYLRNLLLNWTMLLPALAAALALPRVVEILVRQQLIALSAIRALTIIAGAAAIIVVASMRPRSEETATQARILPEKIRRAQKSVYAWLGPLLLSGLSFCVYWASGEPLEHRGLFIGAFAAASGFGAAIYAWRRSREGLAPDGVLGRIAATIVAMFSRNLRQTLWEIGGAAAAGAGAGALLLAVFAKLFPLERINRLDTVWLETYVLYAVPLFLAVFFVEASLIVGITTLSASDHDREWWARSAAWLSLCGVFYVAGTFAVVVLPVLLAESVRYVGSAGGASAIASWLLGKRVRQAKPNGEKRNGRFLMLALQIAAAITLLFVIALIALGTTALLRQFGSPSNATKVFIFGKELGSLAQQHIGALRDIGGWTLLFFILAAGAIAIGASTILNVNIYSMHGMYRNRLIRAYLGASRWHRHPDAFTGFDPQDNMRLWELRPEILWPASFIDFDSFARQLAPLTHVFGQLPRDLQNRVTAFNAGRGNDDRERVKTSVIDALNLLMISRDIEHRIDCQASNELLRANRLYLESKFDTIKPVEDKVELKHDDQLKVKPRAETGSPVESAPQKKKEPIPDELLKAAPQPVRGRPPLHVINAALNLVKGSNLAWQERKAAPFTMTPLHSGSRYVAYRDSALFGDEMRLGDGISLGTAVAISGAAVSPNMGSQSSPIFTFLMTLFNARLGWWVGNPKNRTTFRRKSPTNSLGALLREALGQTDDVSPYVFLSDGGFFDNLGLYEMVARRCKFIIVCDASADGSYGFGDLGNAVRKVRIDLGIPIDLTTKYVAPAAGEKHGKMCALGRIRYADIDGAPRRDDGSIDKTDYMKKCGYLLYIKPAVFEDCPPDVRNYRTEHASFPHDTTADQFFSESQFESYRAL